MPYLPLLFALLVGLLVPANAVAQADPETQITVKGGKIFYTSPNDSSEPLVHMADYRYDERGFSVSNIRPLNVIGLQGFNTLEPNPQNDDFFLLDNNQNIVNLHKNTGEVIQSVDLGASIKRVSVIDEHRLITSSNGRIGTASISANGLLRIATIVSLATGSAVNPTHFIPTPSGIYFTKSSGTSPGAYGKVTFQDNYREADLEIYYTNILSARGGVYDPFTDTVILMGLSEIAQIPVDLRDPNAPNAEIPYLSRKIFPEGIINFDFHQGTVDGKGRLFAASLSGHLVFIDYSQTRRIDAKGTFIQVVPLPNISDVEMVPGRPFQGPEQEEIEQ